MSIRQPRLLGPQLQEIARLQPLLLSLHLTLNELSTAELTLPPDAPAVSVRNFVELYDENGSVGVFRVTQVQQLAGMSRVVHLVHSLCTLRDDMAGTFAFTGTVRDCITAILACQTQPLWALGEVDVPTDLTVIMAVAYTDLLGLLQQLLKMLPEGYGLDFTQSGHTWLMHLRALPAAPDCEGRLSRNLHRVAIQTDTSRLCTRVYPFGAEAENQRLTLVPLAGADYLQSGAADTWGVVSRTFTSDLIFDVPTLQAVAALYLERHDTPEITLTVEASDLSAATHEPLDAFRPGKMCRICLPEMGLTQMQRVLAVDKPDVLGQPGHQVLTLSSRTAPQSEAAEITELVHRATASKLLGGTITEITSDNRMYGSVISPVVHFFDVEDWAAVLDVRVSFTPSTGVSMKDVRVDTIHPPQDVWQSGSFSAMPYLRRDELGCIAQGQHSISFYPSNGVYGEDCWMSSGITLTVIEKATTKEASHDPD